MEGVEDGYHLENAVVVVGEGFVLTGCQFGGRQWGWGHGPLSILR